MLLLGKGYVMKTHKVFALALLCGIAVCGCTGNQDVNSIGADVDTVQQESVLSEDEQLVQRYVELVNNGEGGSVTELFVEEERRILESIFEDGTYEKSKQGVFRLKEILNYHMTCLEEMENGERWYLLWMDCEAYSDDVTFHNGDNFFNLVTCEENGVRRIREMSVGDGMLEYDQMPEADYVFLDSALLQDRIVRLACQRAADGRQGKYLFPSKDSGKTWESGYDLSGLIDDGPLDIVFLNMNEGFVLTDGSVTGQCLLHTTDGGKSWIQIPLGGFMKQNGQTITEGEIQYSEGILSVSIRCESEDGGNAIALQFVSDDRGESFIAQ